ncbi:MAG: hypothetical protein IJA15_00775 [Clostridia bacterium]|nr:hypothetical protein [Clostridia bacterium]
MANQIAKKTLIILISVILVVVIAATTLIIAVGCKDNGDSSSSSSSSSTPGVVYNNENDPLVFSSQEVDKVFNPFFSTAAPDSNVVGLTQIGMIGNDKDGNPVWGDEEGVVTKDLEIVTTGSPNVDETTTYYFVLKNNVKFSNGSPLTMKDVLFNLYVYLDPAYTGSSTIYSTDIVGLKEYRTQSSSETEQDSFGLQFQLEASSRITALIEACQAILEDDNNLLLSDEQFKAELQEIQDQGAEYNANLVADYTKAVSLFREELETDYSNSRDSYEDTIFTDENGNIHRNLFTTDVEMFLYNEGYITWNKKEATLRSSLANDYKEHRTWTKEQAIDTIIADKIPGAIDEVLMWWNTSFTLNSYIYNQAMEKYFQTEGSNRKYTNISGIKFANKSGSVKVNGKDYAAPQYNADGSVKEGYNEVLSITINDVDPKAIWNFSFTVAPMYYYSDAAHISAFDYENNFGVEYASQTFMNEVVKDPAKLSVPVGAGAYAASKASGGITNIAEGDFYDKGVIYFERNPYYVLGPAKIKKIRYQVVSSAQMLNNLYSKAIDFVEPNAKVETIDELKGKAGEGIGYKSIQTAGYGYIGINAGKVPDIKVRQAIMHAINTQECVNYYKTTATAIYRPMSLSSWAYPKNSVPYYNYIGSPLPTDANLQKGNPDFYEYVKDLGKKAGDTLTEKEQIAFLKELVESSGYTLGADDVYVKNGHKLKYTFTIAGEESDHPAFDAMWHAMEILNKAGFSINVTTDANALKKLSEGSLTVWAAAWGSTIDPDMYQVYHIDSTATSTLNWGYKQIKANVGNKYATELALVEDLSEIIERARKTNDQKQRTVLYSNALDIVMQLAVELPTYQRDDLYAYNANKIDVSTFTPNAELSPYMGLTSNIHTVSLRIA